MNKYSKLCASLISILGLAACGGGGDESSSKAPGVVIEQAVNSPQFLTCELLASKAPELRATKT